MHNPRFSLRPYSRLCFWIPCYQQLRADYTKAFLPKAFLHVLCPGSLNRRAETGNDACWWAKDNTRLICDYFQKPQTIVGFLSRKMWSQGLRESLWEADTLCFDRPMFALSDGWGFNDRVAACNRATTLATMFRPGTSMGQWQHLRGTKHVGSPWHISSLQGWPIKNLPHLWQPLS